MAVGKLGFSLNFLPNTWMTPFMERRLSQPLKLSQSGLKKRPLRSPLSSSLANAEEEKLSFTGSESALIEGLLGVQGRGRSASPQQLKDVEDAITVLEDSKGVSDPTSSSLIEGRWQLIFTTRPGTASPIQRTFVGVDNFSVFQEVRLRTDDPRVTNIVRFSDAIGELKVEAAATIKNGKRILFQFDRAAFSFKFLPFKVPYPVPFKLLGDEAKGWLDTTYLSHNGSMRISRGNKGTTFVLQKVTEPRQRLLSAISTGKGIKEVIDELVSLNQNEVKDLASFMGEWQLLWTSQSENEGSLDIAVNGFEGLQIIKENGELENLVNFLPGVGIKANGNIVRAENNMYNVTMTDGVILVGTLKFPLKVEKKFTVELLYLDNRIRITRSHKQVC
ncbi:hypothetical protein QJS10_CPB11g02202 [Acorus calamus]|uniref:Plastid lipid-associated protein/fibrillin conserved domain-containing protein n=1 Tax=Acorus calamus TaxID=4465 RepID=A0AAV9DS37_ACOCL|nr:hypothetical protein QJS10_CPB11g02202 [Acorus calamus]